MDFPSTNVNWWISNYRECLFSWPGIGSIILSSVTAGDYPVIMITTLMISVVVLFASLLVDIMAAILDPRIRY
ncbi:ABC transporter permease subunit [Streptococcus pneumoniae]|uniref:ABC transporter permease subunit n=1 Tax=Streptococcus pneumoniae TaxID=1313 RepID=UPI0038CD1CA2